MYIPSFSNSLVPASVLTSNSVAMFARDQLHVLAATDSTVDALGTMINQSDSNNTTLLNIAS